MSFQVTFAVVFVLVAARTATAQSEAEILVAGMQDGNKVIYLRHAATNANEIDTGRLGDRAGQRNLSAAGIAQAKALGNAFRMLNIPRGEILVSPVFRARDTGELAFGSEINVTMDLVADDYAGPNLRAMIDATRHLLRKIPPPGDNRVLIGHRTPLELGTATQLPGHRAARGWDGRVPAARRRERTPAPGYRYGSAVHTFRDHPPVSPTARRRPTDHLLLHRPMAWPFSWGFLHQPVTATASGTGPIGVAATAGRPRAAAPIGVAAIAGVRPSAACSSVS